jgi:hypothetical protein
MTKWIKVEHDLPETFTDVWFHYLRDGHKKMIGKGHYDGSFWNLCGLYSSTQLTNDPKLIIVTHWKEIEWPELD